MYDIIYICRDENSAEAVAFKAQYPHARMLQGSVDHLQCIEKACTMAFTEMFWLVSSECLLHDGMDLSWKPPIYDRQFLHHWPLVTAADAVVPDTSGIWLVPRSWSRDGGRDLKLHEAPANVAKPFDVFFVSYDEVNADDHHLRMRESVPRVKRVSGIKGINNAHRRCAELSTTSMFYTVDADTIVDAGWDFSFVPSAYDRHYLHLWYSTNVVNGLEYGWGGIKLWPSSAVLEFNKTWLDFTTTVGSLKIMPHSISTSVFNSCALSTWRSAFREAVKLAANVRAGDHGDSLDRLWIWLTMAGAVAHAEQCLTGAQQGLALFITKVAERDLSQLQVINDFEALGSLHNNLELAPLLPRSKSELKQWLTEN